MKPSSKLILASNSPRRRQLLEKLGIDFTVQTIDFDETFSPDLECTKVAEFLAIEKNKAHRVRFSEEIIITADTVVIFSDRILGKPADEEEASKSLKLLSGKIHSVMTGVCVSSPDKSISFAATTEVKFRELTDDQILTYVASGDPLDKAGSYGIQDWIGLVGVEWIKGSYYNVVGLPVDTLYNVLQTEFGFS